LNQLVSEVGEEILAEHAEVSREERISLEVFFILSRLSFLADLAESGDQEAEERLADALAEIERASEWVRQGGGTDGE
jgi:hypothetical protein